VKENKGGLLPRPYQFIIHIHHITRRYKNCPVVRVSLINWQTKPNVIMSHTSSILLGMMMMMMISIVPLN